MSSDAFAEAQAKLAAFLASQDRLQEAENAYRRAMTGNPGDATLHLELGKVLRKLRRAPEAAACFHEAIRLRPDFAEAHFNLGKIHSASRQSGQAIPCYRAALAFKPDYPEALNNLANELADIGEYAEALDTYEQALAVNPDFDLALDNMGRLYAVVNRMDEAVACFRRALEIRPDSPESRYHLGHVLYLQGLTDEAAEAYRRALAIAPDDAIRIRLATLMPVIPDSKDAIARWRERFAREVGALLETPLALAESSEQISASNFYLAYHGLNDRELQTLSARLYLHACPLLAWNAPHCRAGRPRRPGKLRVGFISTFLRQHSIGKTTRGLVANLDREQFEVHALFLPRVADDDIARFIRDRSDAAHEIPLDLRAARERIAAIELDILFYQDIGMEAFTYALAFSRLAPVQCVSFGHPDTTGVPNMDWWVSSELFEPAGAEDHYSEQLFRLRDIGTLAYYYRPQPPAVARPRADFGLPDGAHVYLCPQTLFKVHPDFDDLVAGILRADPQAVVAFIQSLYPQWAELLRARLGRAAGADIGRVQFVPYQHQGEDYLNLLATADVILDTPHFNGMNTSLESFAVGVPVVTWPGEFQRGRHTYGMYRKMGIEECIAGSAGEYVAIAVRLANDPDFRESVKARIRAQSHLLFEDRNVVREFERFFLEAHSRAGAGH